MDRESVIWREKDRDSVLERRREIRIEICDLDKEINR